MANPDDKGWFDHPRNVRKILWALYTACGLLLAIDFVYHRHADFEFEQFFGFYGLYGFGACVALVLIAKELRKLLSRPEDYYGEAPDDR
jgi:hypothetical protein